MEVILLERIANLGSLGDIVNVRAGYARNFLVPQRKAKVANAANLAEFEELRADLEAAENKLIATANERKKAIEAVSLDISANAGQEGKLFGSVTNIDIADQLSEQGVEVERREVRMPDGPIRNVGEYAITIHLHSDVDAVVNVKVTSEDVVDEDVTPAVKPEPIHDEDDYGR